MSVKKGAIIITISILLSRFLSLFFIFPFSRIVGKDGLALYSISYVPFVFFLDLTTLGIPLALAKETSKYLANNKNPYGLIKGSLLIVSILSIMSILVINLIARKYLNIILPNQNIEDECLGIRIISISLLFTPLTFLLRGIFQGYKKLKIIAISQVFEQIIRVSLILLGCYIVMKYNKDYKLAVYMALIATSVSSLLTSLFLFIFYKRMKLERIRGIFIKKILFSSIPFLILGISLNLYQLIDSIFYVRGLLKIGIENAKYFYGIYSFEINKLIMIPISISIGYATSILPNLATRNDNMISKALYQLFLIVFPIFLYTYIKGDRIYSIFFNSNDGGAMLKGYSVMIILLSFNQITSSIMQGINKGKTLCMGIIISILLKFVLTYPLILMFNIYGSLASSFISLMFIIIYNFYYLRNELDMKYINEMLVSIIFSVISVYVLKININNNLLDFMITSIVYFLTYFIFQGIHRFNNKLSNKGIY